MRLNVVALSHCLKCGRFRPVSSLRTFQSVTSHFLRKELKPENSYLNFVCKEFKRRVSSVETKRASTKLRNASLKDLKNIILLAAPHKWRIFVGMTCLLGSSSIYLLIPRILGKLIDEHDPSKKAMLNDNDIAFRLAKYFKEEPWAIVALLLVGAALICARTYSMHTAGQLIVNDLRTKVFGSVLRQDMAFFDRNKVGEIVSRLSTDALIVGYSVSTNLSDGARALVTFFGSGGLMVYTSTALCQPMILVIPIIVGTFYGFGNLQRKYTMQMQTAVAEANQVATERLTNIRTVRVLVAEEKEMQAYRSKINDIWNISKKEGFAKGLLFGGFQFTGYISLSTILFYGSSLINQGLLTYGDLSSFCLYSVLCAASLSNMSGFFTEIMKGLGASTRLFELEKARPTILLTGGLKIEDVTNSIQFDSVAFSYAERAPSSILKQVTFQIPAGKITAVVGPSGSGKSTIGSLLLRLYDPSQGRIMIDDNDLNTLDPSEWRRIIGCVSQEPVLFSGSIRDNICYGAKSPETITNEQLEEAAIQSNCYQFIQSFPEKFDTPVGEQGSSMLSGGQKQRIAIARALITKPRLLILDEATSALDATSEYLVRSALDNLLKNKRQTVLIIAHRLSTVKHANQIVVLDKGMILEQGTFEELLRIEGGIFQKLVEKQDIGLQNANIRKSVA